MTTTTPLPLSPEAAELAARHQLGDLKGSFAPKRLSAWMLALYYFTLAYLLVLVIPAVLFFLWLRRYPNFSRRQAAKRLHLFESGMIVQPQSGDGMIVLRWESVKLYQDIRQKIVNGIPGPIKYVYDLVAPQGQTSAKLTEFYDRPDKWGPWMQGAVARVQAPATLDALDEGGTMRFGDFEVSRTGIATNARHRLTWNELERIDIVNGRVHVMKIGETLPWGRDDVKDIANLHLFLTVAENYGGRN